MNPIKAKNIYWGCMPLPKNAKSLGVYKDTYRTGCLIQLASGLHVCGNAGVISTIPQQTVYQKGTTYA